MATANNKQHYIESWEYHIKTLGVLYGSAGRFDEWSEKVRPALFELVQQAANKEYDKPPISKSVQVSLPQISIS